MISKKLPIIILIAVLSIAILCGCSEQKGFSVLTGAADEADGIYKISENDTLVVIDGELGQGALSVKMSAETLVGENGTVFGGDFSDADGDKAYSYYFYCLSSDGYLRLYRVEEGRKTEVFSAKSGLDLTVEHILKIVIGGEDKKTIEGYADGRPILCVEEQELFGNGYGLLGSVGVEFGEIALNEEKIVMETVKSNVLKGSFVKRGESMTALKDNSLYIADRTCLSGEIVAEVTLGDESEGGIIFGANYSNLADFDVEQMTYYYFAVSTDRTVTLSKILYGHSMPVDAYQLSEASSDGKYLLRITRKDGCIKCFVDGQMCAYSEDNSSLSGESVGLFASTAGVEYGALSIKGSVEPTFGEKITVSDGAFPELNEGWNIVEYNDGVATASAALYIPYGYSTDKSYPILMYLHGDGENTWSAEDVALGECAEVAKRAVDEVGDTIVFAPASDSSWVLTSNDVYKVYPFLNYPMAEARPSNQFNATMKLFDKCVDNLSVDEDRQYLNGYSRGTIASWYLLSVMPEKFAAAVLCCCIGDPELSVNYKDVPIWVFMGNADGNVAYNDVKEMYDNYEEAGGEGHFTTCIGGGHGISQWVAKEKDLITWLYSKKRLGVCEHDYSDESVVRASTCTECGLNRVVCNICGKEKLVSVKKLGHNFVDGVCDNCGEKKGDVTPYTYGVGGPDAWKIEKVSDDYKYTTLTSEVSVITLSSERFVTGTVEWDMTVTNSNYRYGGLCGIVWASANENIDIYTSNYYVCGRYADGTFATSCKNGGSDDRYATFYWEDAAKILGSSVTALGTKAHYKFTYDGTTITLTIGAQTVSFIPNNKISGSYIGIISEAKGTVFENVVVRDTVDSDSGEDEGEELPYTYGEGGSQAWEVTKTDDGYQYTTVTSEAAVITLSSESFVTGTVEWDMTVTSSAYRYGGLCGIAWASENENIDIYTSNYYVCGRFADGTFVTSCKNGGSDDRYATFYWEDAAKIPDGELMALGKKVHYKFSYDGTTITLTVGTQTVSFVPNNKISGSYIGIISEAIGTTFENIVVTAAE